MFSYERAGRSAGVGRDLERGRPLAAGADASTAAGRAQRGAAREREGAFGNAVITADVRYSLITKHYPRGGCQPAAPFERYTGNGYTKSDESPSRVSGKSALHSPRTGEFRPIESLSDGIR